MKVHLVDSDDPLVEGRDYFANCTAKIPKVAFKFMWDTSSLELPLLSSINTCKTCFGLVLGHRYVYGIVPGEESLRQEEAA